jgi:hypothetical protein
MRRRPLILAPAVSAVAVALLAAGCGGGTGSPGVASVDSSTPPAATTTQSDSGSGEKSPGPSGGAGSSVLQFRMSMNVGAADGRKFSSCMRKHGVPSFPDPNSQGVITIHSGMGIDPGSPAFESARSSCDKLLPNGGQPTPAQLAQRQQEMLAFSTCMRAHGLRDFPDPSNGGLRVQSSPGSDLNPNNPTFQRAQQACQKDLPFKGPAGTAKSGD